MPPRCRWGSWSALEFLAFPVLGLVAGVTADRVRRRPLLIAGDLGRAVALASIPIAAHLDALTIYQMYGVALVVGIFTVFFDVSYQSYLPALIDRADLVEGNSKLEVSRSAAQVAGPGLAGFMIQALGGAAAIVVDAISYVGSAVLILLVRKPEPKPSPSAADGSPRRSCPSSRRACGRYSATPSSGAPWAAPPRATWAPPSSSRWN